MALVILREDERKALRWLEDWMEMQQDKELLPIILSKIEGLERPFSALFKLEKLGFIEYSVDHGFFSVTDLGFNKIYESYESYEL